MIFRLPAVAVLAFLVAPQQTVFRAETRTVAVYATVRGPDGRLITTLNRDDFQVLDNGKPAEVTVFSNEIQPITVAAMLDTSGSMGNEIARVKRAAMPFIDALLPADRVRFGTFGHEIALSPLLTNDKETLRRIVREEIWPVSGSPVWTAMDLAMRSLAAEHGRRVVLTLSDGEDACAASFPFPCASLGDVRKRAVSDGFIFYVIDMEGAGASRGLKGLAEVTGGGQYSLRRDAELADAFTGIVNELHHQYALGFVPAALDGAEHKLEIRVSGNFKVTARKTYVARESR